MLSDEWLSRYGLLENFNASVTRTRTRTGTRTGTGTGTGTWTTGVTAIALCTSCSRAKNVEMTQMKIPIVQIFHSLFQQFMVICDIFASANVIFYCVYVLSVYLLTNLLFFLMHDHCQLSYHIVVPGGRLPVSHISVTIY